MALDFCDCGCPDGRDVCDCIARDWDEPDPLEQWLFSDRSSDPLSSGAGFSVNPNEPGDGGGNGGSQQCSIANPGIYECPVLNGECLYGAYVQTHGSLNAIDLITNPQRPSDVVAPFDGTIVKVRSGREYSYCKNRAAAGGAIWYQGEFNGQLTTLFMYHVNTLGLTEGQTYQTGDIIAPLSRFGDFDMDSNACSGGPHLHMEIASNNPPYTPNQPGPIAAYSALMGCPTTSTASCQPEIPIDDVADPEGPIEVICRDRDGGGGNVYAELDCLIRRVADNVDVPAEFLKAIMQRETSLTSDITGDYYTGDSKERAYITENYAGAAGPMQFLQGAWGVVMNNYESEYIACIQDLGFTDSVSVVEHRTYVGPSLCAAGLKFRLDANFVLGYEPRGDEWWQENVPYDVNPDFFMGWEIDHCPELKRNYTPLEVAARRYYGACLYGDPDNYQCGDNYCDEVMDFARGYDPVCPAGANPIETGGDGNTETFESSVDFILYPLGQNRRLPEQYCSVTSPKEPGNLVEANLHGLPYFASDANDPDKETRLRLISPAAQALDSMLSDMQVNAPQAFAACGFNWGYRSATVQNAQPGGCGAGTGTACACYSEHQLGTAVDFRPNNGRPVREFKNGAGKQCYDWLADNAHRYGYIQSYVSGTPDYYEEPWHWRWVGESIANEFRSSGQSHLRLFLESR
ncbi:MAG: D-alanyl-D-alanine carboxypeptidase [candidate division WS6 bacterium OLB20]|uniref:D-alanyl-D-alanine carboxypeptidase n=1 Tax=candidate division WS6 bacterium OLB20 TaxID=1617426 RepID=A0A136M0A4_9BACT|nr:MAG: D-alanyl-D-alanine carboxypeptidase [candidate division WS6 bacterium OLB20]